MSLRPLSLIVALFSLVSVVAAAERPSGTPVPPVDYGREIKPLLTEHCIKCHGPDKAEGGLNLSERTGALQELDSGSLAIVPGKPEQGELLARIRSNDPDLRMPPGEAKPLTSAQTDLLSRWIAEGAEYQLHWAFRPLDKPAVPQVQNAAAVRNPIDAFILKQLEASGIAPSPEADPHTLIKRAYLDLVGLLPTTAEVEAYVHDKSPDKYEMLIDRLLASPHFGERWGRHWLDLARYADSDGYEKDRPRPDAYVFRDWVIKAFNDGLPFDEFTIQQLAGDLLPNATPQQKIATAFNRQTLTNTEGGTDQEEFRVAACMDRTDTLGAVWLGMTVGCAKCHSHKYDPISQTEYYRLFAFFNGADEVVEKLPVKAKDLDALEAALQPLETALDARYREIAADEQRWEDEERAFLENTPNTKLKVEPLDAAAVEAKSGVMFTKQKDGSWLVNVEQDAKSADPVDAVDAKSRATKTAAKKNPAGEVDTYTITLVRLPDELTGLRLDAIPDPSLPKHSAARSDGGNFVITRLRAELVDSQGKVVRDVPLQRASADFEQTGYKAADALTAVANTKKGWAVTPEVTKQHYLQVRTFEPLKLGKEQSLRVVIEQNYGNRHTLGRFRLQALTGDARELHLPPEVVTALKMYPEKRVNETRQLLFDFYAGKDAKVQELMAKIDAVNKQFGAQLMPVRLIATARKPRNTHRFDRGDFLAPQEKVEPNTFGILPALKGAGDKPTRLDLARWLVGKTNPLTPRVIANQFWARLFGNGIVRSVGDFGSRGETPSHPELLDWLAVTYRDDLKWDTKAYLKTILMSAAYRQASTHRPELVDVDPQNVLLARQNRLRVEAEIVRDLALEVGGLLSSKIGGPSVYPPMPADLAKLSYANNFSWTESTGEDRYRRGMYTFFKRTIPHPTLMTFDCPDANLTCVIRSVSNTPLQALTLLNNEAFVESSQSLAKRLLAQDDLDDRRRLAAAVRACLCREPETDELDRLENLLEQARRYYANQPEAAESLVGRYAATPVPNTETASWVATLRVLINLDEFITRE